MSSLPGPSHQFSGETNKGLSKAIAIRENRIEEEIRGDRNEEEWNRK